MRKLTYQEKFGISAALIVLIAVSFFTGMMTGAYARNCYPNNYLGLVNIFYRAGCEFTLDRIEWKEKRIKQCLERSNSDVSRYDCYHKYE